MGISRERILRKKSARVRESAVKIASQKNDMLVIVIPAMAWPTGCGAHIKTHDGNFDSHLNDYA